MKEDEKMHVLFLSSWFPTSKEPFNGNFVIRHAEAVALYAKVSFINVTTDPLLDKDILKMSPDIHFYEEKIRKKLPKFLYGLYKFYHLWKLYKNVVTEIGKPDIIHTNVLYPSAVYGYFLKMLTKTPFIITEHWTGYLPEKKLTQSFPARLISSFVAKKASAICPVTENLRQAMISKGFKNNYFIVTNVTNLDHFHLPAKKSDKKTKTILHVSSLIDEHKNITGIIELIKRLSQTRDDFELSVIGDGNAEPHISFARKLNIPHKFLSFHGPKSPVEIGQAMREADFLLLFSNYENFPCVIVEAYASGLPVVSTNVGGISEHLTVDKGIMVEPGDSEGLYNAVNSILDGVVSYDKKELYEYAVRNFSYEAVGKKFLEVYRYAETSEHL